MLVANLSGKPAQPVRRLLLRAGSDLMGTVTTTPGVAQQYIARAASRLLIQSTQQYTARSATRLSGAIIQRYTLLARSPLTAQADNVVGFANGYRSRRRVVLPASLVTGDVDRIVHPMQMSGERHGGSWTETGEGIDSQFEVDGTAIPFELRRVDSTGLAIIFVQRDTVTAGNSHLVDHYNDVPGAIVPQSNPALVWARHLFAVAGDTGIDATGLGRGFALTGTTATTIKDWPAGQFGPAGYGTRPSSPELDGLANLTLTAIVDLDVAGIGQEGVVFRQGDQQPSPFATNCRLLYVASNRRITWREHSPTGDHFTQSQNNRHKAGITVITIRSAPNQPIEMWIDGEKENVQGANAPRTGPIANLPGQTWLGSGGAIANHFQSFLGRIAHVEAQGRIVPDNEIVLTHRMWLDPLRAVGVGDDESPDGVRSPVALPEEVQTSINTQIEIPVLDNDIPASDGTRSLRSVAGGPGGTYVRSGGLVRFTPSPGFTGVDEFSYVMSGSGVRSSDLFTRAFPRIEVIDDSAPPPGGNLFFQTDWLNGRSPHMDRADLNIGTVFYNYTSRSSQWINAFGDVPMAIGGNHAQNGGGTGPGNRSNTWAKIAGGALSESPTTVQPGTQWFIENNSHTEQWWVLNDPTIWLVLHPISVPVNPNRTNNAQSLQWWIECANGQRTQEHFLSGRRFRAYLEANGRPVNRLICRWNWEFNQDTSNIPSMFELVDDVGLYNSAMSATIDEFNRGYNFGKTGNGIIPVRHVWSPSWETNVGTHHPVEEFFSTGPIPAYTDLCASYHPDGIRCQNDNDNATHTVPRSVQAFLHGSNHNSGAPNQRHGYVNIARHALTRGLGMMSLEWGARFTRDNVPYYVTGQSNRHGHRVAAQRFFEVTQAEFVGHTSTVCLWHPALFDRNFRNNVSEQQGSDAADWREQADYLLDFIGNPSP